MRSRFVKREKKIETPTRTVVSVLMEGCRESDLPDLLQTGSSLSADQILYIDLIGKFKLVLYRNIE